MVFYTITEFCLFKKRPMTKLYRSYGFYYYFGKIFTQWEISEQNLLQVKNDGTKKDQYQS